MSELVDFIGEMTKINGFVSAIITGIFTFLITKYTYHKNIPLDKYEKVYNRVYYPIYCLIKSDKDMMEIVEQCDSYLRKYMKYVDKTTIKAFQYFKDNIGCEEEKKAYTNFKSNIFAMDTKLRKRLGYLEPNVFSMYTYSNPSDRRMLRMLLEIIGTYIPAMLLAYVKDEDVLNVLTAVSILFLIALLLEVIVVILLILKKLGKKLFFTVMWIGKNIFSKIKLFTDWIRGRKANKKRKRNKKGKK